MYILCSGPSYDILYGRKCNVTLRLFSYTVALRWNLGLYIYIYIYHFDLSTTQYNLPLHIVSYFLILFAIHNSIIFLHKDQ